MSEIFLTYRIINDRETALDFSEILKESNIPFFIEEDAMNFDPSYANNPLNKDYRLKIRQQDFAMADKAFEDFYKPQLGKIEKDYYLFEFTDPELQEIIAKPDEWGFLDYELAKKILTERGIDIQPGKTTELKNKRIYELAQPETIKTGTIILVYIAGIIFPPVGVFVGWYWGFGKKTLPNGNRVLAYSQNTRNHGIRIFAISLALVATTMYLKIFQPYIFSLPPREKFPDLY